MVMCAVFGCNNNNNKKLKRNINMVESKVKFYTFPKDNELRKLWVKKCCRQDEFNVNNGRICSVHFREDHYVRDLKSELLNYKPRIKQLKKDAFPTEHLAKSDTGNLSVAKRIVRNENRKRKKLVREMLSQARSTSSMGTTREHFISSTHDTGISILDECMVVIKEEPRDEYGSEIGTEVTEDLCLQEGEEKPFTKHEIVDTLVDTTFPFVSCGKLEENSSDTDDTPSKKKVTLCDEVTGIKEECILGEEDILEFDEDLEGNKDVKIENLSFLSDSELPDDSTSNDEIVPRSEQICPEKVDSVDSEDSTDKFRCSKCGKEFSHGSSLKRHELTHSDTIRKFTCDVCNKSFTRSYVLKDHKLVHSNAQKFYCDICNKAFTQRSGMVKHRYSHNGVKRLKRDKCNRNFTRKDGLKQHYSEFHAREQNFRHRYQPMALRYGL